MIGQTLALYKIDSLLGGGGMGEVYQTTDLKLVRVSPVQIETIRNLSLSPRNVELD